MPKTGMYVLQGIDPAAVATAPFDVKIIDIYDDAGQLFTPPQVQQMGGGPGGGLLLGYFSIGEAENFRDYFATLPPADIGPLNPSFPGDFEVAYWTDAWKAVATTYLDRIIEAGYDGIFLDVVDEYQQPWAVQNAPGHDAAGAMVNLVKYLADHAHAINPDFKIWANNAEELLSNDTYLNSIDGMVKEDLFYQDNGAIQPASETNASLALLNKAIDAGKDVIAVEYVTGADKIADVHAKAAAAGVGSYIAHPDLNGIDFDGVPGAPCYRAGTRILTIGGEVAVEDLAIGDHVVTASGKSQAVTWIGHRRVDCARHPDPRQVWPVRVRAGAFAEQLPCRDLFLSPDHSVFVEGVLIPIKLLVNGTTIDQVKMNGVVYYHVELPRHDVLLAEGLPAELYLDTGNRGTFANGGLPTTLHPAFDLPKTWSDDAAAPLAVDEARVRPVWQRLAARSYETGQPISMPAFTDDAALHLRAGGQVIGAIMTGTDRSNYVLPPRAGPLRLVSRSGELTDARPWASDRRRLGISVHRIIWYDTNGPHELPLDHPALEQGWWGIERSGARPHRWTNGDAALPVPPDAIMVEIYFSAPMPYAIRDGAMQADVAVPPHTLARAVAAR